MPFRGSDFWVTFVYLESIQVGFLGRVVKVVMVWVVFLQIPVSEEPLLLVILALEVDLYPIALETLGHLLVESRLRGRVPNQLSL